MHRMLLAAATMAVAMVPVMTALTLASPASGVTPTVLARGTYDQFKVMSDPDEGGLFKAKANGPIDLVIRRHEYAPGGSTGWHQHPYSVLITVLSGTLTFYEYDDPTCTAHVVTAGNGYVDSGHGHLARNETGQPATDVSAIFAPVGGAFRNELPAPGPHCGF